MSDGNSIGTLLQCMLKVECKEEECEGMVSVV
jgi:hypothetical protein